MQANILKSIYGSNKYFFLSMSSSVSRYRKRDVIRVPRHDAKPRKLLFSPKNIIVNA